MLYFTYYLGKTQCKNNVTTLYLDDPCLLQQGVTIFLPLLISLMFIFVYEDVYCEQKSLSFLLATCLPRCHNRLHHVPMTPMPAWKKMIGRCRFSEGWERFTLLLGCCSTVGGGKLISVKDLHLLCNYKV